MNLPKVIDHQLLRRYAWAFIAIAKAADWLKMVRNREGTRIAADVTVWLETRNAKRR
jgi:hypothetical protein